MSYGNPTSDITYSERVLAAKPPGPAVPSDVTLVRLKEAFLFEGIRLFKLFVDQLYPEDEHGRRVPLLHEVIDDEREEWLFLEETYRAWALAKRGLVEPDSQTKLFEQNADGARERLTELRGKYSYLGRMAAREAGQ